MQCFISVINYFYQDLISIKNDDMAYAKVKKKKYKNIEKKN